MQELVSKLDIKGCLVTADALNCQKKPAIIEANGDYLLFVKSNQLKLMEAIKERVDYTLFIHGTTHAGLNQWTHTHCRATHRVCVAIGEPRYLGRQYEEWTGIKSFGAIISDLKEEKIHGISYHPRKWMQNFS